MADIKLDVSGVKITVPVGYTANTCKTNSKACKTFVKFASASYFDAVRQLDEAVGSAKDKYVDKQKITKLEDICPDIRLSKSAVSNFYPENVSSTFARLTECRQRLANAAFSDSPVPSIKELAATQCLKKELRAAIDGSDSLRFRLPVGKNYKNCFEMTVPFKEGYSRLIDVRLPNGYKVDGLADIQSDDKYYDEFGLPPTPIKLRKTEEGGLDAYRFKCIKGRGDISKTFLVQIRPSDEKMPLWRDSEIDVLLVSSPVQASE